MAMRSAYGQSQSGVEAVAVIERLKQRLKDDDVSPTDSTVAELRHAAQELLADTLMGDIQSASSGLLDKHLWQHGFYNHMVLFRQRLKRFDAEAAKGSASAVSELAATRLGLKSFLHAGIGFYTALIHGVCERYRLVLPGLAVGGLLGVQSTSLGGNHGQASAVDQRYATATCQRALLYLGDLSRYLQLYCVSNPRWSGVKGYYTQALAVLPQSGSPHGQLAIVASLERANVDAAYHYSRAALAESPSAPATENLVRMYAKLLKEGRKKVDVELPGGQRERRGLHHVCLQGVIMVHAQILSGSKSVSLTFDNDRASTVAALGEVVRQQSTHAGLPCGTLQKLFCVFVFSLHHAAGRERGGSRSKRAVVFMLDFFSCMLGCARAALAQGVSNGGEEETPNDGRDDALATAKLIADWLQSSVWCWCGSPDVTEGAPAHVHRHGAWTALATLLNSAASAVGHGALLGDEADETARPSLPEDVLLAGFSPASPATTTATTPTSIGADAAVVTRAGLNEQRLQRLFAFGEFLADTLGDKPEDRVLTSERDDLLRSGRRFSASHRADANPLVGVDRSDGAMAGEQANLVAGAATIIGAAVLPTSEPTHDAFGHPLPSALDSYSDDEHAPDLPDWLTEGDTFGAAAIAFSSLDLGPPGRNATSDADAMDSLWGGQSLLGADLVSNMNGQIPEGGGGGFIGAPPPLLQSNGGGGGGGGGGGYAGIAPTSRPPPGLQVGAPKDRLPPGLNTAPRVDLLPPNFLTGGGLPPTAAPLHQDAWGELGDVTALLGFDGSLPPTSMPTSMGWGESSGTAGGTIGGLDFGLDTGAGAGWSSFPPTSAAPPIELPPLSGDHQPPPGLQPPGLHTPGSWTPPDLAAEIEGSTMLLRPDQLTSSKW